MRNPMPTCVIRYEIDPTRPELFKDYAQNRDQAIPRRGAGLIGSFAPQERLVHPRLWHLHHAQPREAYRARLALDPLGRRNYDFARTEGFIRREERTFLKLVSAPQGGST